jgi:hypothetical protein
MANESKDPHLSFNQLQIHCAGWNFTARASISAPVFLCQVWFMRLFRFPNCEKPVLYCV